MRLGHFLQGHHGRVLGNAGQARSSGRSRQPGVAGTAWIRKRFEAVERRIVAPAAIETLLRIRDRVDLPHSRQARCLGAVAPGMNTVCSRDPCRPGRWPFR